VERIKAHRSFHILSNLFALFLGECDEWSARKEIRSTEIIGHHHKRGKEMKADREGKPNSPENRPRVSKKIS